MRLTSLVVQNMFSYYGTNTIYFDAITCVIGTNGLGKTSLLNAIKLCLGTSTIEIESVLNNNAEEKKCAVVLNFDSFSVKRTWRFENKVEESLSVVFEDESKLEDAEAEHFLQNKIPNFLVDFLFYDGEVGDNLLLLSSTRLKSIFDYVFDLDLLENTRKDSLEVAKRLLENSTDVDTKELLALENKKESSQKTLTCKKDEIVLVEKELKTLKNELQKTNTKIKNKSKKTKELHKQLETIQVKLDEKSSFFKELILWQMPLLLNEALYAKLKNKEAKAITIEDESLFANKFEKFATQAQSPLDTDRLLDLFKSLMVKDGKGIELSIDKDAFKTLTEEMKQLQLAKNEIMGQIKEIENSLMEEEVVRGLVLQREGFEAKINTLEEQMVDLEATIFELANEIKETDRTLTQAFKVDQDKYSSMRGYRELKAIASASAKVYARNLEKNLDIFNKKLKQNTANFLRQYEHIEEIFIDAQHKIVVSDGKKILNTKLLSAGQKQILNFLIIKTILEFKKFASFVMVDTPFGRLSSKNKDLLLSGCYLEFDVLVLLLTDSEYEFVKTQNLQHKHYQIQRTLVGSKLEEIA
ncbi:hypothetical protein JWV37_10385 [Sulfurospirillum sp. T05]|uniref:Rad50/SbcC-type AAA domain-containing protein n=1 Tax=Sulfurospirillum tamanense TaxID=2813362 RepID=A0ABS2WU49_9BACT|nr:hypothetical protein [Sulfurospirillum tamanensis]